jgi:very-short-patch-repair endonuclease
LVGREGFGVTQTQEHTLKDSEDKSRVIRLVDYLIRLASLRTKIIRDVAEYQNVLWIKDIPRQKGCFTQAWGGDEDFDSDVWIEVQTHREPDLPGIPPLCKDWVEKASLRDKGDIPDLLFEITREVENPAWHKESDQPEFIPQTEHIEDHPEVRRAWDQYVEEHWLPWVEAHNDWECVHNAYSKLFAIHQEQLRLGEEYELVLGLGLLTWQTPSNQRVRRHLIVSNAVLEFEARLAKFTVRPLPDGASVRPELDMLDIEEQPARAEETARSSLTAAGDDPWERDCIEGALQALVHSISAQGEYDNTLESKNIRASEKPTVEYAPALILRKRSARGLTETLKRIKERIERDGEVPGEFGDLAEIWSGNDIDSENDPGITNSVSDGEVFFPKPSNEEQRRIMHKLRASNGVLVQGPPGTGKSHTIANLICHLLATGQRALITAKTPRALQVLERLVVEELRPLCINLLGSGLEEKRSLESSVAGILRKNEEWNAEQAGEERKVLEQKLGELREEKTRIDRRLRSIRESETYKNTIADGSYLGTAARIAEAVNRDRSAYEWFEDTVPFDQPCPISETGLQSALMALRRLTPERRRELILTWPDAPPSQEKISSLFLREKSVIEEEARWKEGSDERIADQLSRSDSSTIKAIHDSLSNFENERQRLSASAHGWVAEAVRDITVGNTSVWHELHRVTHDAITSMEPLVHVADDTSIEFLKETNIRTLLDAVCKLKEHMQNGGKLGWGPFRPKQVRDCVHVIDAVRVNGRSCLSLEHLSMLADALRVHVECEKAWNFWAGRSERTPGPYALQLQVLKGVCDNLASVLSLENAIENSRKVMQRCPYLGEPTWTDESKIKSMIASCRLALARDERRRVLDEIRGIEAPLTAIAGKSNAHPIARDLIQAVQKRDVGGFARAYNKIEELRIGRRHAQKLDDYITKLRTHVPRLTEEFERTFSDPCWEPRIQQIKSAWHWAQAKFWIEEYIRKEDAASLDKRARQIESALNTIIANLAALHAWSYCFSRLKESHRRHMEAWQQSMRRLGKGTGKHASRHRREAQQHLNECREAVPAWVMPLHRIWDTVDPAPGIFDVIIVDEASQCGVEALPLFYLGKKILIVGDDKQISPDAVGLPRDAMHRLMEEFLYDFRFKSSFDIESSLFDHGKLRYGTKRITLREHFRCMPEIIRFSNDLCYSDTPLIPLRQYGSERLTPIEHIPVIGGYREGSNNSVINQPEARAIVEKIAEFSADPRYDGKTMGVVVLQGEAQASLIESLLLQRLGAEEMDRRRLVCGNPYSFQGDERDIMFLSMVAATNERIGPLTKSSDERRFNVAASRARDQMFLFHSVSSEDLSESCLRRRLLEFFQNRKAQEIAGIGREELERRAAYDNRSLVKPPAPFESWFEVDVALVLLGEGFNVLPQYEIAGKRIDLVVDGGKARLAIECDGDEWHAAEQYEADMQRQRQLERCGWEFFRVRESAFYSNREGALEGLWRALEERGIFPGKPGEHQEPEPDEDETDYDEAEDVEEETDPVSAEIGNLGDADTHTGKRAEEVTMSEIHGAIMRVLSRCPNNSCTIHSMTARVLKDLGIFTRGNPRADFERRVMRSLSYLETQEFIEKYKAKNRRVKLLPKKT